MVAFHLPLHDTRDNVYCDIPCVHRARVVLESKQARFWFECTKYNFSLAPRAHFTVRPDKFKRKASFRYLIYNLETYHWKSSQVRFMSLIKWKIFQLAATCFVQLLFLSSSSNRLVSPQDNIVTNFDTSYTKYCKMLHNFFRLTINRYRL